MDREKIERIWQAAHKLAETAADPPASPMHGEWRRFEKEVVKEILQLNMIVMAP